MISGQKELNDAIWNRNKLFFEAKPLDFGPVDPLEPISGLNSLSNILVGRKALSELKGAVDKIHEVSDYDILVQEAFRKGKKPPFKLSENEKNQIKFMIKKFENVKT